MYDTNGSCIVAFQDKDLREVFGTLSSNKRKQHHRRYLDKIDKVKLHDMIDSVFMDDQLYKQYMNVATPHYRQLMRGRILMDLIKSSLLYMQYPQRQSFSYEGLIAVQILFLRNHIYKKVWGLKNAGFIDEEPIKLRLPKKKLFRMAERLANVLELETKKIFPQFMEAIEIDKYY